MADDIRSIVLRFTGEDDSAKSSIEAVVALLAEVAGMDVDADVNVATAGAEADIAKIVSALELLRGLDVEVDVDINEKGFNATVPQLIRALRGLSQEGNQASAPLSKFQRVLQTFGIATGAADGGVEELTSTIGNLNINLPGMLGRLNAVSGAAFLLAASIGTVLVAALGALIASLAEAAAGLGALAIAFGAALGPAVLLVVAVVQRLTAVWQAFKAQDQEQLAAQQRRIQGNAQEVASQQAREQAAEQLKRAQADLGNAAAQAYRQMEDAAEAAKDAVLDLERVQLSQEEAALSIKESQYELKKFREELGLTGKEFDGIFDKFTDVAFDPSKLNKELAKVKLPGTGEGDELRLQRLILNIRDARLREKDAIDGVHDATVKKTRADAENARFVQQGINASPQYVSALRAVADAHRAVAKAASNQGMIAAQSKALALTENLSGAEQHLLTVLRKIVDAFKAAFGPALDAIIEGIAGGLDKVAGKLPQLAGPFRLLGRTMGAAIAKILDALTRPKVINALISFAGVAAELVGPLTDLFLSLADILLNIAKAALPFILPLVKSVAEWFARLGNSTGDMDSMFSIISGLVGQFMTWWDVLKSFGNVFLAFLDVAAPGGKSLAQSLADGANALAGWLRSKEGQEAVRDFLETAVPLVKSLVKFFFRFLTFLLALGEAVGPILKPMIDLIGLALQGWAGLLHMIAHITRLIGEAADWVIDQVLKIIKWFGSQLGAFSLVVEKWPKAILDAFKDAWEWLKKLPGRFIDLGKKIVEGVIKGIKSLADKLKDTMVSVITAPVKKVGDFFHIGSPSKLTEAMGEDIVKGMMQGLQRARGALEKAVTASLTTPVISPMVDAARIAPSLTAAAALADVGGDTFIDRQEINTIAAGGGLTDPRAHASQLARELARGARRGRRR